MFHVKHFDDSTDKKLAKKLKQHYQISKNTQILFKHDLHKGIVPVLRFYRNCFT